MDSLSVIVPFASLVVGWYLNEMSKKYQISRERRAHVGRALSNLLELHHQIRSVENAMNLIVHRFDLPKDQEPVLHAALNQLIPQADVYVARYEEAIEQLSESDPVVAFNLRTKAQIPRSLAMLRTMGANHGATDIDMAVIEKQVKVMLVPHLEIAIKELADLHGRSTLRQVNRMLDSPFEMP